MAASIPAIPSAQLTLRPRPEPPPEVVAAIAASQLLLLRPGAPDASEATHLAWRFSERWWARPMPMRRERPWVRR
jgi:hypothetical protein